jgi:hypothetical protein
MRLQAGGARQGKAPDGSTYETEFPECFMCCAMYHWPQPGPACIRTEVP